ncbi:metallophosphoesterase [bacterium]|nr:metallophosphoesterase [bacterium]
MKLAVTADVHLTDGKKHPERFHALGYLSDRARAEGIDQVVIAGDLFDAESRNYAEFDEFCRTQGSGIRFIILPGNHDLQIRQKHFTAENIRVLAQPEIIRFEPDDLPVLFIPYLREKGMGEVIAAHQGQLRPGGWILAGHGEWIEGMREPNPLEPGVYMPIGRNDVDLFQPAAVLLGHIHKPTDSDRIHYPGSPCPLHILETGPRRFLILETRTATVESRPLASDVLYFNESFLILPVEDEAEFIRNQIVKRIESWQMPEPDKRKIRIRVSMRGYTSDKQALAGIVAGCLKGYSFYDDSGPDLSQVSIAEDTERAEIARRVLSEIRKMPKPVNPDDPKADEILLSALHTIYGD